MRHLEFGGRLIRAGVLTALFVAGSASVVGAGDTPLGLWMTASSSDTTLTGRFWGRLILEDGDLRFESPNYKWRVALSQIKRVDQSKAVPRALEVETFTGAMHFIAILDAKLTAESPRKAIQMIQRSMRDAAATPRPTLLTRGSR